MGIAFIGTGRVAEVHAGALNERFPGLLKGGWNRTGARARAFSEAFGGRAYEDLNALLEDDTVDAVIVATSTETHFDMARRAIQAGKHVLLEKPLCSTADEVEELERLAAEADRICMPSHNYIYAPEMRRIHARVTAGALGRIASFWVLFNNVHPADVGQPDLVMRELMVHHVYSMLYFLGRPESVCTTATNCHFSDRSAHDQIMVTAEFQNGTIANLWGSFATDDRTREPWSVYFKVLGFGGGAMSAWDEVKFGPEPEPLWDDASYRDSFLHTQTYFLQDCLKNGAAPLSRLSDAIDGMRILDAARASLEEGRRIQIGYD